MFEKKYTLLRSQKKRVYDILREAGLEPGEFHWSQVQIVDRLRVSQLNHRGTDGYHFQFSSYELNAWCIACPGKYRTMDYRYPKNWEEQERVLWDWAQTLRQELETPDPWTELAKYQLSVNGELSGEAVNEPIPAVEAEGIGAALRRLSDDVVLRYALAEEPAALVRAKFEYLAEAARRQRSRDWIYTMMGVWASLGAALALSEEQTALIWAMLRTELGAFATLLPARVKAPPAAKTSILGIRLGTHKSPAAEPQPTD